MQKVYCRCTSGHYFVGAVCPWDGWYLPGAERLRSDAENIAASGRDVTIRELRAAGVSDEILARTIVIEFGNDHSAFEATAIWTYLVNDEEIIMEPPRPLGRPMSSQHIP